ncbi:NHL repeat-containing protein [Mucilaginibacter sp. SP1R1]|uniref:NHL repeat-containing protein n=1 Tax=Mucilaginibacter sp. SP1R1 TaxID=2723091 RepID=UPI001622E7D1|nr:NHL repeat-containing protein [Mucilaginibacter sp. SP1R1]MBB6149720.1 sugar lactone lactonase YvrE [Mucilaginibacter sp. SP1R1]
MNYLTKNIKSTANIFLLIGLLLFTLSSCTKKTIDTLKPQPDPVVSKPDSIGYTTTFAGSGGYGYADGKSDKATFNNPNGLAIDSKGNLYVTDQANNMIRKVSLNGTVTTLAGNPVAGHSDGKGTAASFDNPFGIAIDASDNIFVADLGNNLIRKITADGAVTTWAGSGKIGFDNGVGTGASFNGITGLAFDHNGNLYVTDNHNLIRKITPDRKVTTISGIVYNTGPGFANDTGLNANFRLPYGMVADAANNIYIVDSYNNMIRKMTPDIVVTTLAGQLQPGNALGTGDSAQFNHSSCIAIDTKGNLYVTDTDNNALKKITPAGQVTLLAGDGSTGNKDGENAKASFNRIRGIAISANGTIYVTDQQNNKIRRIISKP